jgi:uncharacterized protein YuzE
MPVQFVYDAEVDAGSIHLSEGPSAETLVVNDNLNLDFNSKGELIAIEVLNVSRTAPGLIAARNQAVAAE